MEKTGNRLTEGTILELGWRKTTKNHGWDSGRDLKQKLPNTKQKRYMLHRHVWQQYFIKWQKRKNLSRLCSIQTCSSADRVRLGWRVVDRLSVGAWIFPFITTYGSWKRAAEYVQVPATEVKLPKLRTSKFVVSYSHCPKAFWISSLAMLSSPAGLLKRAEHSLLISMFCAGQHVPSQCSAKRSYFFYPSPNTQKQLKEETNLLNEGNNEMKEPPNRSSEDPKCQTLMTLKVTKFIHNVRQGSTCVLKGQLELFSAGRGDQLVVHSTLLMTHGMGKGFDRDSWQSGTRHSNHSVMKMIQTMTSFRINTCHIWLLCGFSR